MKNTVIHGDCLEVMKTLEDKSIDMVLTSPPYDNLRDYKGYTFNFEGIAQEIYRVLKDGGVCVWVVGDATIKGSETGTSFKQALYFKEIGFNIHDTMIYKKNTSTFPARKNSNRYTSIFEYMFVFSKGIPKANLICDKKNKWGGHTTWGNTWNRKGDVLIKSDHKITFPEYSPRENIWEYKVGRGAFSGKGGIKDHPAVFPEKLAEDHILSWSNEGDIILDPMAGSGTTLKMAKKNNRNYIGIETSQEYIDIINKRILEYLTTPLNKNL